MMDCWRIFCNFATSFRLSGRRDDLQLTNNNLLINFFLVLIMIEAILKQGNEDPLQEAMAFMAQLMKHFGTIQQALEENVQLKQRVAALESENAALTETLEQWKHNDEWSNRVTYDNVVDQIASLEDASKRDDARRMFEALLKKSQVAQFRRDIKKRVKELNEEGDTYSDAQVAEALESLVGKGQVIDAKWKWAAVYWYLRWTCNYPVDVKLAWTDKTKEQIAAAKGDNGNANPNANPNDNTGGDNQGGGGDSGSIIDGTDEG
jgi:hypothetical protein